ncbi:MAG: hypothetical protein LDL31_04115 [Prosthecobacter sp.]|nr:hypothetical protein [Prosthecobacter sp.]
MELWSSIRDWVLDRWLAIRLHYRQHPLHLHLTWTGLFFVSALGTRRWAVALLLLAAAGVILLYHRFGLPWVEKGRRMLERGPQTPSDRL